MKSNFVNLELSIILPTYNESKNLRVMIPKIEKVFKDFRHEIIVVDDNSTDNTIGCLKSLNKNCDTIRLVTRLDKKGIGSALCDGYDLAKGDIILSSDADLSFSVEDMLKLVEGIKAGHDLMLGCRHVIEGSYYEKKGLRTAIKGSISKFGNTTLRILTGINIHDFSANFRAIKKSAWKNLILEEHNNLMLFEMIVKAKHKGMRISEIPVSFIDRVYGESKLKLSIEIPRFMLKMFYYILKYR